MADSQRRAAARGDHEIVFPGEQNGEAEGAGQSLKRFGCRGVRRHVLRFEIMGDQLGDDFSVRLGFKMAPGFCQFSAQFGEILNNAVMNEHEAVRRMGVCVGFRRCAMGRPARMPDARFSGEGRGLKFGGEG